jgi:hypothetical protein
MQIPVVHRREFLKLASVAAVGVALSEKNLFSATSSGVVPLIGVGFAASLPKDGFSVSMADASSILSPDPTFISRAARVSVVGSARSKQRVGSEGGVGVDAYFPITGREAARSPRFSFWSATGDSSSGGRIGFRMPALATTGLSFVVRRIRPTNVKAELNAAPALETEISPITLSLGNVDGPKLTRGVYAFALREEDGDFAPNWNRVSLINQNGQYSLSGTGVTYVLLQVDYDEEQVAAAPPARGRASRH